MADPAQTVQDVVDTADGGWGSRKMAQTFVMMALASGGYLVCAHWPSLAALYPTYLGAILGIGGMYHAADLGAKHILGKQALTALGAGTDGPEAPPKA